MRIYVHIPFCIKKCKYCDFLSFSGYSEKDRESYVFMLLKELKIRLEKCGASSVESIYIGGGTPSYLSADTLKILLEGIYELTKKLWSEDFEYTVECNPESVSNEKLALMKKLGANRVSFGLQSADDKMLAALGRAHSYNQFLKAYKEAREAGFKNINIDLMSALPGQSLQDYKNDLKKVIELNPEHISSYSLIIEEGTEFYKIYGEESGAASVNMQELPDEDTERQMYYLTEELLKENGYHRYEISNYARDSYESRHNSGYWKRDEYIGIGLGAASLINNVRYKNVTDLATYISGEFEDSSETEVLSREDIWSEYMFLGLRMCSGVKKNEITEHFKEQIERLVRQKLLIEGENYIKLSQIGMDLSNIVLAEFV